jgi:hypothetical protein
MCNELLAIDDACEEIMKLGKLFELNLRPPIPKPINLAGLRETLKQIAADAPIRKHAASAGG